MIQPSHIFEVYQDKAHRGLYTKNLVPGKAVYTESLIQEKGAEYREWDPTKSKLAASILKGSPDVGIRKNDVVLYLGAATGTTVSHVSDIVGSKGLIFAVEMAPRVTRALVFLAEDRKNIAPGLADANKPLSYASRICQADVVYQDIAQRNQSDIFLKNVHLFVKKGWFALLAVKARSVDVAMKPRQIFNDVRKQLEKEMVIVDYRVLEPFQKDHCMFICKYK